MFKQIEFIADGRFYIDENGVVLNSLTNHIIKPFISNKGYPIIDLNYDGNRKKILVHRLVAQVFLPNPNNYPVVMHLDNNRMNSNVNNLKWGTYLENNKQAIDEGRMIVPRPDNRKYYAIYHPEYIVAIICNGINEVINELGFGNYSQIRNYIFRKTPIPQGKYQGWYITLFDNIR